MSETAQGSRTGSQFGPYRILRLLGRGGMGEVYEAYDTVHDRPVALKLMSAAYSQIPEFRSRLLREARIAGRLQHPHVVPIHRFDEIDGQLFVDMQLIDGTDLNRLLHHYGPFASARAVAIVAQIASALDAAHAAGVLHRDVKPANILITGEDFAYLVDFGCDLDQGIDGAPRRRSWTQPRCPIQLVEGRRLSSLAQEHNGDRDQQVLKRPSMASTGHRRFDLFREYGAVGAWMP